MSNSRTFRTDAALDEAARFYGDEERPGIVDHALGDLGAPEPKWSYRCRTHGKEWSGQRFALGKCQCCGRRSLCRKCDVSAVPVEHLQPAP